jgi:hypothetical protein
MLALMAMGIVCATVFGQGSTAKAQCYPGLECPDGEQKRPARPKSRDDNRPRSQNTRKAASWVLLGEGKFFGRLLTSGIFIRNRAPYTKLKLASRSFDLQVQDLRIYYTSGEVESLPVQRNIRAHTELVLRLNSRGRLIQKVVIAAECPPCYGWPRTGRLELLGSE